MFPGYEKSFDRPIISGDLIKLFYFVHLIHSYEYSNLYYEKKFYTITQIYKPIINLNF